MPAIFWVILPFAILFLLILWFFIYTWWDERREVKQRERSAKVRERCRKEIDAAEKERKELRLPHDGSPEAERLDLTLREMNSVVRDGYRSTDKIEELSARLPGEMEALKKREGHV